MARRAALVVVAVVTAAAAVSMPAASLAGGWATVGLASLPDRVGPGETWVAEATILQHGRTPLEGVSPRVLVASADGDRRSFAMAPTDRAGIYRARVVFPSAGDWSVSVDDGFTERHSFGHFEVDASEGGSRSGSASAQLGTPASAQPADGSEGGLSMWTAVAVALGAGALASLGAVALGRRAGGGRTAPAGG